MSFRSIVRDVRDSFGSLSRRSFEVRLPSHYRGKSHGFVHEMHEPPLVIQNSPWANLPPELLRDVIKRLEESESTWPGHKNVVACAAVSRSWRDMCKEIVRNPDVCGKLTFPVSLKQPGARDGTIQCFMKRDKSNLTYHLFLCLSPDDDFKELVCAVPEGCCLTIVSESCHIGGLIDDAKEPIGESTTANQEEEEEPKHHGISSFFKQKMKDSVQEAFDSCGIEIPSQLHRHHNHPREDNTILEEGYEGQHGYLRANHFLFQP